jgi:UDP-N-acetylmuramate--alanine ligase
MDRWRKDAGGDPKQPCALHAHLAGVTGRGMEGLARVLMQGGLAVSASAPSNSPAAARLGRSGIRIHAGHPPRSCVRTARWLVCDQETSRVDPLRLAALSHGVALCTPGECLGALLRRGIGLALAGGATRAWRRR